MKVFENLEKKEYSLKSLLKILEDRYNKDITDKLYFYSKSRDVNAGDGVNEFIKDKSGYNKLSTFTNWRRVLSNFHIEKFTYNKYTYNSIEHAQKVCIVDKELAFIFTIESGSKIGLGDGNIARKTERL